jgi:hypothetical protein
MTELSIEDIPSYHPEYPRLISALNVGKCPDCENLSMTIGPRGGLSRNLICANCLARFNVAPWYDGRIPQNLLFVQRIVRGNRRDHAQT